MRWRNSPCCPVAPTRDPGRRHGAGPHPPLATERDLTRAVEVLYALLGINLLGYKPNVLQRRLLARMRDIGSASPAEYLARLEAGGPEAGQEARRFLASLSVRVSTFFRDPQVFTALGESVFPELLARGQELRVWSAGCSRGQETYSLAYTLHRSAGRRDAAPGFSVLGTDVDAGALRQAGLGVYSAKALEGVPDEVRGEMFEPVAEQRWRVLPHLRRQVRFEAGNVLDPATHAGAERFDLVACRNLLIYLDRPAQEELILALRRTLRPGGYLVLGSSETVIGRPWGLLEHVDPALRIYRRPQ
ncbi:MAG: protein-glutamate O-methyltransferase CheR [Deferrisomatales bacterium]|nr:protein-glutamate O-methyltransferase CheR [Deferrisomatales bacterium]